MRSTNNSVVRIAVALTLVLTLLVAPVSAAAADAEDDCKWEDLKDEVAGLALASAGPTGAASFVADQALDNDYGGIEIDWP